MGSGKVLRTTAVASREHVGVPEALRVVEERLVEGAMSAAVEIPPPPGSPTARAAGRLRSISASSVTSPTSIDADPEGRLELVGRGRLAGEHEVGDALLVVERGAEGELR